LPPRCSVAWSMSCVLLCAPVRDGFVLRLRNLAAGPPPRAPCAVRGAAATTDGNAIAPLLSAMTDFRLGTDGYVGCQTESPSVLVPGPRHAGASGSWTSGTHCEAQTIIWFRQIKQGVSRRHNPPGSPLSPVREQAVPIGRGHEQAGGRRPRHGVTGEEGGYRLRRYTTRFETSKNHV
jgi:hypothetical protein